MQDTQEYGTSSILKYLGFRDHHLANYIRAVKFKIVVIYL